VNTKNSSRFPALVVSTLLAVTGDAFATEGGGSVYPQGSENYMAGALPPPGLYGLVYTNHYTAGRLNDSNGNDLQVPGFKVTANVIAPRIVWLPGTKFLGGDLALHAIVTVVDLKVNAGGLSQSKSGVGDVVVGIGTGYHHSANLHSLAAVDLFVPTGSYDKSDLANIGRNYWAAEPIYSVTYVDRMGFNGDIKVGYLFNARNRDTDYRSGQEFHFDYALGWGLGNGLVLGAGGYVYRQTTSDTQAGATLANSKGQAFAIGPSIKYDSGKGWFVTAKWQKELNVENRPQGSALWIKAVFPL